MQIDFKGSLGHTLTSLEWLILHHRTKEYARKKIADNLSLFPGMKVLDLGCGPGFWTHLLAEQVAPTGMVKGIDIDKNLIDYAVKSSEKYKGINVGFAICDFNDLKKYDGEFDIAFSANCLAYFEDPENYLRKFKKVLRPDGRIICRHFDHTFWLSYPVPTELTLQVMYWASLSGHSSVDDSYFDNSLGQTLHKLLESSGYINVKTESVSIDVKGPLNQYSKDYISITAFWTAEVAKKTGKVKVIEEWLSYFDHSSANYILDRKDCLFTFLEFTAVGSIKE